MEPHRVANLNLKFPALTTPSSFQAFARSPRPKSRRVLDLKVPNEMQTPLEPVSAAVIECFHSRSWPASFY